MRSLISKLLTLSAVVLLVASCKKNDDAPNPTIGFTYSGTISNPNDTLTFTALTKDANSVSWNFGDGTGSSLTNPSHNYTSVGDFQIQLIATSQYGCSDTAYQYITTDADVVFPNAFTPNGDGQNDLFLVRGGPFKSINVRIYNNWGQLIFETNDQLDGWNGTFNGTEQPIGVFVWVVEVEMFNGKKIKKTGDVTLLR